MFILPFNNNSKKINMRIMELFKKCEIKIFNIENPQKFTFRTIRNEIKIQNSLRLYLRENTPKNNYIPLINEVIIAKILNKYLVVRVKKVINDGNILISFIETGKTKTITMADVFELKEETIAHGVTNTIFVGGIDGILPASMVNIKILESKVVLYKFYLFLK